MAVGRLHAGRRRTYTIISRWEVRAFERVLSAEPSAVPARDHRLRAFSGMGVLHAVRLRAGHPRCRHRRHADELQPGAHLDGERPVRGTRRAGRHRGGEVRGRSRAVRAAARLRGHGSCMRRGRQRAHLARLDRPLRRRVGIPRAGRRSHGHRRGAVRHAVERPPGILRTSNSPYPSRSRWPSRCTSCCC